MSHKRPAILATIITVILLVISGFLFILIQMLALNGFSERQGTAVLGLSLVCQGTGILLSGGLAMMLTRLFVERFNWNKILAVALAVVAGTVLGLGLSLVSLFVGMLAAGTL
ncbi:MAG: hypothetical protein HYZ25_04105 [Chloroflexi bacterium]|nr:hypothetical protein [Chloroflexota bacterium]